MKTPRLLIPVLASTFLLTGCPAVYDASQTANPAGLYTGTVQDGGETSSVIGLASANGDLRVLDIERGISIRATFATYQLADASVVAQGDIIESGRGEARVDEGRNLDIDSTVDGAGTAPHNLRLELDREPISDALLPREALAGEWYGEYDASWAEIAPTGELLAYEDVSGCTIEGKLGFPEFGAAGVYRFTADLSCPDGSSRSSVLLGLAEDRLVVALVYGGLPYVFTAR